MISGSAMIECGTGSVKSTSAINTVTGAGVVGMRSGIPEPICTRDLKPGEFETIMNNAEVMFYFHNVESLDSLITTFLDLRDAMIEERARLDKMERDE